MKTLEFKNLDNNKQVRLSVVHCNDDSVNQIVQWYGAFHAGDRVILRIDGTRVKLDKNLELVTPYE
jgi:hypothetical protein